jgi:hypothetical protein
LTRGRNRVQIFSRPYNSLHLFRAFQLTSINVTAQPLPKVGATKERTL